MLADQSTCAQLGTRFTVSGRPEDAQVGMWAARAPRACFSSDACKDILGLSLELSPEEAGAPSFGPQASRWPAGP